MELVLGDNRVKGVPALFKRAGWLNMAILFGMDVPEDHRSFIPPNSNIKACITECQKRMGPTDSLFIDDAQMTEDATIEVARKIKEFSGGKMVFQYGSPGTPGNARNVVKAGNFQWTMPVIWDALRYLDNPSSRFYDAVSPQLYFEIGVELYTWYDGKPNGAVDAAKQLFSATLFLARIAARNNQKPLWPIVGLLDEHQRTRENARWIRDLCEAWECERMIGWGYGAELFFQ